MASTTQNKAYLVASCESKVYICTNPQPNWERLDYSTGGEFSMDIFYELPNHLFYSPNHSQYRANHTHTQTWTLPIIHWSLGQSFTTADKIHGCLNGKSAFINISCVAYTGWKNDIQNPLSPTRIMTWFCSFTMRLSDVMQLIVATRHGANYPLEWSTTRKAKRNHPFVNNAQ